MSRTASGSDINEKTYSLFLPIEKLAKVIVNQNCTIFLDRFQIHFHIIFFSSHFSGHFVQTQN